MIARRRWLGQALVAAVSAPALIRHASAADVPRFELGVASGHPRPDGMVLWTRLTGTDLAERIEVAWEVALDEAFTQIAARGSEQAEAAWAHSVHAEPSGLAPGRVYWYRFSALGARSRVGRTRTAPAPDAAATLRFVIASCQRFDAGHYAAWRDVVESDPELVLFLGDYIYESGSPPGALRAVEGGPARTLAGYRRRYAQYKSDPLLQAAHAAAPWLMVWDDHEVENDYAGRQSQTLQFGFASQRQAAYQAYWEHLPFPKSARPSGPDMRITGALDWGRLARIHLLDDRQYRDPQACPRPSRGGSNTVKLRDCPDLLDPKRTLLGTEQEQWLQQGWSLERSWNLLAQQTLMARFSWQDAGADATYWTDGWDGYAPARKRLLSAAAERKVPGLVVLGGDVHTHYVAQLKADYDDARSPVVGAEFCGTSISSPSLAQARIDAALAFNPHVLHGRGTHRGTVHFKLDARSLQADLRAVDDARDAASAVRSAARFVVLVGQPGVQPA
ncbi:MAG TPA: alkaline phosphatase D family protein [Rubrivivax sp.]